MKTMNVKRKNTWKVIRTFLQLALVAAIALLAVQGSVFPSKYRPAPLPSTPPLGEAANAQDHGFIAISYLGVEANDTNARVVIPQDMLKRHLQALKDNGYVTITMQDVAAYYERGQQLPEKAVLLMFEDGLKSTPSLAQKLLQQMNFHASAWVYGVNLENPGRQYLTGADLAALNDNSYWDIGSSGYRLSYINVFDRYGHYVGELSSDEYAHTLSYLDRKYDHYLMDFLRDEDDVPLENNVQMAQRVEEDYRMMQEAFREKLGFMPSAHSLMHANTGRFGTHELVSAENERWIKDIFQINFNREGYARNDRGVSAFDLTRMQPYADWSPNHLLMRIQAETGEPLVFAKGSSRQAEAFTTLAGQADFHGNTLYLTSNEQGLGAIRLSEFVPGAVQVTAQLKGNAYGSQMVYIGADERGSNGLGIGIVNNHLVVTQKTGGQDTELFSYNLAQVNPAETLSTQQDEQRVVVGIQDAIIQYSGNAERVQQARQRREEALAQNPVTVAQGGETYVAPVDQLQRASRQLSFTFQNGLLDVTLDGQHLVKALRAGNERGGYVLLESRPIAPEDNQRNVYDPIYDGVFHNLSVKAPQGSGSRVYFSNEGSVLDKAVNGVSDAWNSIVNWFLTNL